MGGRRWGVLVPTLVLAAAAGDLLLHALIRAHLATVFFAAVGCLGLLGLRGASRRGRAAPIAFAGFWVVFAAWAPLAAARSLNPPVGRAEIVGMLTCGVVALAVVALTGGSAAGLARLRLGWSLALAFSVVVAGGELLTGRHLDVPPDAAWAVASRTVVSGVFHNPNDFALALVAMTAGALAHRASLPADRAAARAAVGGLAAAGSVLVLLTESRTGLGTLVVVLGLFAWRAGRERRRGEASPPRSRRGWALVGGGAGGLVVAAFAVPALAAHNPVLRLVAAAGTAGTARSDHLRLDLLRAAWRYFVASDRFGTGAATFETLLWSDPDPGVSTRTWLHNGAMELLLQYGVVVAGALAVVVVLVLAGAADSRRRPGDPAAGLARTELLAMVVAFAGLAFVSNSSLTITLWWVMLADAVGCAWWLSSSSPAPAGPARLAARVPAATPVPAPTPAHRPRVGVLRRAAPPAWEPPGAHSGLLGWNDPVR